MNNKLSVAIACGVTTMCLATTGYSADLVAPGENSFNVGGDVELDLTTDDANDTSAFNHGGRIKINVVGHAKGDNDYFVKGVAQPLVLFNPGTTALDQDNDDSDRFDNNALAVDDLYFQIGKKGSWDIKMGRFEAFNLLPLGKDTVVQNVAGINVYSASDARGRTDDSFHAALSVGSTDSLYFELGVQGIKNGSDRFLQVRPVIAYNLGGVKLHAGYEDLEGDGDGFAIGAGFKLAGGDVNASVAVGNDFNNPIVGTVDVTTFAINYTRNNWGVGILNADADRQNGSGDEPGLTTIYGAYTVPLFGIKDASVTFAGSYSDGDSTKADGSDDDVTALRARFNYTF